MKLHLTFCILVAGVSSALGVCLNRPVHLMSACAVRNLTIFDTNMKLMTNDNVCDNSLSASLNRIDSPFKINFTNPPSRSYQYASFFLAVVDLTAKQPLWMVANITANGSRLIPPSVFSKHWTMLPYQPPTFNASHSEHQIEILVFNQSSSFPRFYTEIVQPVNQSFHLATWMDNQIVRSGVTFCGPVAGALIRINNHVRYYPTPPSTNGQHSSKSKKSAATRFTFNWGKVLMVAGILYHFFL